jgi:hypothetical protein
MEGSHDQGNRRAALVGENEADPFPLRTALWIATRYPGLGVEALEGATRLRKRGSVV